MPSANEIHSLHSSFESRTILFADQSGFYPLPGVVRTFAPAGETPVLRENCTRDHLSAMSAITLDGKLFFNVQDRAYKGEDVVTFLRHLLRLVPGKMTIVWDGNESTAPKS